MSVLRDFYRDLIYAQTFGSEGSAWLLDEGTPEAPASAVAVFIELSEFNGSPIVESFFADEEWMSEGGEAVPSPLLQLKLLVGGEWKTVTAANILIAGQWQNVIDHSVLQGGIWK